MTNFVEPDVGLDKVGPEPQSDKPCDKCLYFERDLAYDSPCGECYESSDKFNWKEGYEDSGSEKMEFPNDRVCETCSG